MYGEYLHISNFIFQTSSQVLSLCILPLLSSILSFPTDQTLIQFWKTFIPIGSALGLCNLYLLWLQPLSKAIVCQTGFFDYLDLFLSCSPTSHSWSKKEYLSCGVIFNYLKTNSDCVASIETFFFCTEHKQKIRNVTDLSLPYPYTTRTNQIIIF